MFVVLANVLPNIGDPILTMGCFVYSVVIAYMMYCALYLASQESKYLTKIESDLNEFESNYQLVNLILQLHLMRKSQEARERLKLKCSKADSSKNCK